jgi:hypothetical protein
MHFKPVKAMKNLFVILAALIAVLNLSSCEDIDLQVDVKKIHAALTSEYKWPETFTSFKGPFLQGRYIEFSDTILITATCYYFKTDP